VRLEDKDPGETVDATASVDGRDESDTAAARVVEGGRARPATGRGAHINLHTNLALRLRARYPRFSRATLRAPPLISDISTGLAGLGGFSVNLRLAEANPGLRYHWLL
jgi:hypothetical protein